MAVDGSPPAELASIAITFKSFITKGLRHEGSLVCGALLVVRLLFNLFEEFAQLLQIESHAVLVAVAALGTCVLPFQCHREWCRLVRFLVEQFLFD